MHIRWTGFLQPYCVELSHIQSTLINSNSDVSKYRLSQFLFSGHAFHPFFHLLSRSFCIGLWRSQNLHFENARKKATGQCRQCRSHALFNRWHLASQVKRRVGRCSQLIFPDSFYHQSHALARLLAATLFWPRAAVVSWGLILFFPSVSDALMWSQRINSDFAQDDGHFWASAISPFAACSSSQVRSERTAFQWNRGLIRTRWRKKPAKAREKCCATSLVALFRVLWAFFKAWKQLLWRTYWATERIRNFFMIAYNLLIDNLTDYNISDVKELITTNVIRQNSKNRATCSSNGKKHYLVFTSRFFKFCHKLRGTPCTVNKRLTPVF